MTAAEGEAQTWPLAVATSVARQITRYDAVGRKIGGPRDGIAFPLATLRVDCLARRIPLLNALGVKAG